MHSCCFKTGAAALVLLLMSSSVINGQATCPCVVSNSIYLTTATPPTTTVGATSGTRAATASYSSTTKATSSGPAFSLLNTSSPLSNVFVSQSFASSTSGYVFHNSSNTFILPADTSDPQLVIDLVVGPTGWPCRSMPYLEQICVSSNCTGCNLNQFTAAAATTLVGNSALSQRFITPTAIVNATVCAGRDKIESYVSFRYIVFLPLGSPTPSQPYQFSVGISGNFSTYDCSSRKRRSLLSQPFRTFRNPTNDVPIRIESQSSRSRRAVFADCSCPVGQDLVLSNVRIVLISFEYSLKTFSNTLGNTNSAEFLSLAREMYYLVVVAVRNLSISNLASVVADFFDIEFSPGAAGVRVTGKMTVRSDAVFSDAYLLSQLRTIIPGYGATVLNLSLTSGATSSAAGSPRLPDFAIALICLLSVASFSVVIFIILWRFNLIGQSAMKIGSRIIQYTIPETGVAETQEGPTNDVAARDKSALGSTLDRAVQMPVTAFHGSSMWPSADSDSSFAGDNAKDAKSAGPDTRAKWAQGMDSECIQTK